MRGYIRWMIRKDMPEVQKIENTCFDHPWSEDDFVTSLRNRNVIGLVNEKLDEPGSILGYAIYELHKTRLLILNIAVHPDYQHMGIGLQLVEKMKSRLNPNRRHRLEVMVRDSNYEAHVFFKICGFTAIQVVKMTYEVTSDDAYLFRYYCPGVFANGKS